MRISKFDFKIPLELIAQKPISPRDNARLLSIGKTLRDLSIKDIPELIRPNDVLVVNNTKVLPARLNGRKVNGTKIQVTLLKPCCSDRWMALARPARKLRIGEKIFFAPNFFCNVVNKNPDGQITLNFSLSQKDLKSALSDHGSLPLPPYIKRKEYRGNADFEDYQTLFAKKPGAIAAPTAGLHFTPRLIQNIKKAGAKIVPLTLHVGAGTFLPVKTDDINKHKMHSEWGEISKNSANIINATKEDTGRIIAIGTTSLRLLETAAEKDGSVLPFSGETDIFITPGYNFKIVDALLTNFHLPRSTLFMLVSAFSGLETMKAAYAHAISNNYRFYSYGDACWLEGKKIK